MGEKLGQNFLVNKEIVKKIIAAADLKPDDVVLEIGPGKGILTEELAKKAGKVVAVEIDKKLVALLKDKFKNQENMEIMEKDVLKMDISETFNCHSERSEAKPKNLIDNKIRSLDKLGMTYRNYKVVANIPYYITAPIIKKFLESESPCLPAGRRLSEMILMVQKEVAERICAGPKKMSILAVSVQYYADAEILFNVPRENFEPAPEVDSAVIRIIPHPSPLPASPTGGLKGEGDFNKKFFRVVRAGFCAKRKTLVNNLSNSFHLPKKDVEEKLKGTGISSKSRAQELSVENWKKLAELF